MLCGVVWCDVVRYGVVKYIFCCGIIALCGIV